MAKVDKGKLFERIGRKVMGLKCLGIKIAKPPTFFYWQNLLVSF
jgi:hypothetical protein